MEKHLLEMMYISILYTGMTGWVEHGKGEQLLLQARFTDI